MRARTFPVVTLALAGALAGACHGSGAGVPVPPLRAAQASEPAPPEAPEATAPVAPAAPTAASNAGEVPVAAVDGLYARELSAHPDLAFDDLTRLLGIAAPAARRLTFDPTHVKYYREAAQALALTKEEVALYRKQGFVSVDHLAHYSMAAVYYATFSRDLPVLITTDSILHAVHRSYDAVLMELEAALLLHAIDGVLAATHTEVAKVSAAEPGSALTTSLDDVDLYLTVARNLLAGAGAPAAGMTANETWDGKLRVHSLRHQDSAATAVLQLVASLVPQFPPAGTRIYGGRRSIDYSQFAPRGHYTKTPELRRYFRAMMWLGRADLGFNLSAPAPGSELLVDVPRERRNAALLALLVSSSGRLQELRGVGDVIDFMVGRADNLGVQELSVALQAAGVRRPAELTKESPLERVTRALDAADVGHQQIRSQVLISSPGNTEESTPPRLFQVFGQRFALDSFVLSRLVYDSIVYRGEKQLRRLPLGLDVAAALGNDHAVELLEPALKEFNYASNLLAARRGVEAQTPEEWGQNLYTLWLDALRTLDGVPAKEPRFPKAMQSAAWRDKSLQTQLASWAELRHDTLLYVKQSYSAGIMCEYPLGYVEPYPELFVRLGRFGQEAARRLQGIVIQDPDPSMARNLENLRRREASFFQELGKTMVTLEGLARKELGGVPFSQDDQRFLKSTVEVDGGGCGPPTYSGWYVSLFYDGNPMKWEPTIADVHTDPTTGQVLSEGVGDATFLLVAVDNDGDRAAYVGPAYSYYELQVPASGRLTDEQWQGRLRAGAAPPRPPWTASFAPSASQRQLGPKPGEH